MYAVIYVIGVFQPKQIKTCAIVCRPFEILCEAAENLTCTRKLFLYNLLCMTHHIIFVNSVWENYKSGVDFAPGRHFGESQPKKHREWSRTRKLTVFSTLCRSQCPWGWCLFGTKQHIRNWRKAWWYGRTRIWCAFWSVVFFTWDDKATKVSW